MFLDLLLDCEINSSSVLQFETFAAVTALRWLGQDIVGNTIDTGAYIFLISSRGKLPAKATLFSAMKHYLMNGYWVQFHHVRG